MCESTVYLVEGSRRSVVMAEAARLIVSSEGVTCYDTIGVKKTVPDAEVAEANLVKHEILLRPRKG